jgi:hypothetical protein
MSSIVKIELVGEVDIIELVDKYNKLGFLDNVDYKGTVAISMEYVLHLLGHPHKDFNPRLKVIIYPILRVLMNYDYKGDIDSLINEVFFVVQAFDIEYSSKEDV